MIPLRLSVRNFMCYRAETDGAPLELDMDGLHVVCLSGHNGSGKSALLDAITWVLWGKARIADDDLIAQGESEMLVDLVFQLGAQQYRVIRRRQRGRTGPRGGLMAGKSQLDLQIRDEGSWRPIGEGSIRETDAQIAALLRMSYSTFVNASFLLQGRADEFTSRSTPAQRKEVLAEMLDLSEYDLLEQRSRERARSLSDDLKGLRGKLEQLEQQAAQTEQWRSLLQSAEARVRELTVQDEAAVLVQRTAEELVRRLQGLAERRREVQSQVQALRDAQHERTQRIAEHTRRIAEAEALLARRATIMAGLDALAAARADLARLEGLRPAYDRLMARRSELREQFSVAQSEQRALLDRLRQDLARLQQLAERHRRLAEAIAGGEARLAELRPLQAERVQCGEEQVGIDVQLARIDTLERRRLALHNQIEQRRMLEQSALAEQQRNLARLETQLRAAEQRRSDLAAALAASDGLSTGEAALLTARAQERSAQTELATARAERERIKAAAEKLKQDRALLTTGDGVCPICRSELGAHGIADVEAHYDAELADLRTQFAAARSAAERAEQRLQELQQAIAAQDQTLTDLRRVAAAATTLQAQVEQDERWHQERAQALARVDELTTLLASEALEPAAQAELVQVQHDLDSGPDAAELRDRRGMLAERLQELDARLGEIQRIEGALETQRRDYTALAAEIGDPDAATAAVLAQERVLELKDFAHAIQDEGRQVNQELEGLGFSAEAVEAARGLSEQLQHWERDERELALAERDLAGYRALLVGDEQLQAKDTAEINRLHEEDTRLSGELRGLAQAENDLRQANLNLDNLRRQMRVAENDRAEKQAHLKRAEADAAQLAAERAREQQLVARQSVFAELAEALGKKGVQAMLIETAIPQIEDEANRLLGRMTDNQMHLSFEMQRDTKKGDTVETLDIRIADTLGTRTYDAFSGGEAMRANFAVRVALSRLLARRAGARLETLVIDEGFGTLDANGRERMVEAITSVQNDFGRIMVITHIDDLKDRFPALIEVTKTPAGSRWEIR